MIDRHRRANVPTKTEGAVVRANDDRCSALGKLTATKRSTAGIVSRPDGRFQCQSKQITGLRTTERDGTLARLPQFLCQPEHRRQTHTAGHQPGNLFAVVNGKRVSQRAKQAETIGRRERFHPAGRHSNYAVDDIKVRGVVGAPKTTDTEGAS